MPHRLVASTFPILSVGIEDVLNEIKRTKSEGQENSQRKSLRGPPILADKSASRELTHRPLAGFLDSVARTHQNGGDGREGELISARRMQIGMGARLVWLGAMVVIGVSLCRAQSEPQANVAKAPSAKSAKGQASPAATKTKPALADLTRVSTKEAARLAAEDAAGRKQAKSPEADAPHPAPVVEWHTVPPGSEPVVIKSENSKSGVVKNVHGDVYGATGGLGSAEGADVGASNKSGKLNVYIEARHAKANTPAQR